MYVCMCEDYAIQTCDIDAGNSVWCQDKVFLTVADNAVLDIIAFTALTVAAVLHRTYDHLAVPLHGFTQREKEILTIYPPTIHRSNRQKQSQTVKRC